MVRLKGAINELKRVNYKRYKPLDNLANEIAKFKSDSLRVLYKELNLNYESVDTTGDIRVHQSRMHICPLTMQSLFKTD
jgi:hypothetical protein